MADVMWDFMIAQREIIRKTGDRLHERKESQRCQAEKGNQVFQKCWFGIQNSKGSN